jgi:hypothetical protein
MWKNLSTSIILLLLCASPSAASGLSLRCGTDLVSPGYLKYEVLETCGEPLSREIVGEVEIYDPGRIYERQQRRYTGSGTKIILYIEEWIYDKGGLHVLRFEGNRLVKVESIRRK